MANIFNDLNKMVNTIQKVDKMLSDKPKRPRIKQVNLTEREKVTIKHMCRRWHESYPTDDAEDKILKQIYNKL